MKACEECGGKVKCKASRLCRTCGARRGWGPQKEEAAAQLPRAFALLFRGYSCRQVGRHLNLSIYYLIAKAREAGLLIAHGAHPIPGLPPLRRGGRCCECRIRCHGDMAHWAAPGERGACWCPDHAPKDRILHQLDVPRALPADWSAP